MWGVSRGRLSPRVGFFLSLKTVVYSLFFNRAFIFGNGYDNGSYDGRNMSLAQNLVVVTSNYRLGLFGFFAHEVRLSPVLSFFLLEICMLNMFGVTWGS